MGSAEFLLNSPKGSMDKKICVFGSYKDLDKKEKEDILILGKLLAEKGFIIVSGGFGGTMEDISRGAKSAGGKTIGVTYYKSEEALRKSPNKYIDEEIEAKDIFERIDTMMKDSDAFIVLPGGTGTLLELAAVLEHINKGLMEPKPVIAIGNFWKSIVDRLKDEPLLNKKAKSTISASCCSDLVTFADNAREAIEKLELILNK